MYILILGRVPTSDVAAAGVARNTTECVFTRGKP